MKIRGDRRCKECDTRWTYYETGSVACPECGSLRSVGVDDRKEHTASPVTLDLSDLRSRVDEDPLSEVAAAAAEECRSFTRQYGFIDAGSLLPLSETYVAARELQHVGAELGRAMRVSDDEEFYLLELLRGAGKGERPDPDVVPDSSRGLRGLAYATAVDHYRSDLRTYLDDSPDEMAQSLLGTLTDHQKRVVALDGDVPLSTAEGLLRAAQLLGEYLGDGDETALAQAQHHADGLDPST
jgi:uncharacterized Zn finger protein (UPF0148 family)